MAKGYSLNIGLNSIDPNHYGGWDGRLNACENDASDIAELAKACGFKDVRIMLTSEASGDAFREELNKLSSSLEQDDLLLLSYSGHGGQLPDLNHDESDAIDETWCLYDGQVVDDELNLFWSKFKKGVRILVLSDSCHSGSVTRNAFSNVNSNVVTRSGEEIVYRFMPYEVAGKTYMMNREYYKQLLGKPEFKSIEPKIDATVRLISGCQDNQFSLDGPFNGKFTGTLLRVWNDGKFKGNYTDFHSKIIGLMPPSQSPDHLVIGQANDVFDKQQAFTI